ncbi:MAG: MFS transporter [Dehalococcoidia bacterium]|nr:MFS transporter [Dehalococcoidia bacterium]
MASLHKSLAAYITSHYLAALEYRDYRQMWVANVSAQSAAWALIVARGWVVYDMTHSSMDVGIVTFAAMGPLLAVPPIAGVLADRFDRRTILGWTYAINLFHNLILALLVAFGSIQMWHIIVLSIVNGTARAAQMSTAQALAANLVPKEQLLNALSLNAATQHASRLIGPGLVSPLLSFIGAAPAFFMCTVLYGVGWIQIMKIKTKSVGGIRKGEGYVESFVQGIKYAWSQTYIRMILVMVFFHCGLTMAFESLLPHYAEHQLQSGAGSFGTLMTGIGAGSLVGSIFIGGIQNSISRGRLYLITGLLSGLGQVMLMLSHNMAMAMVAVIIMGGSQAAFMTLGQAVTQALAADEYRGRVASINTLSFGGIMAIMNLVYASLAGYYNPGAVLAVGGLAFTAIMLVSVFNSFTRKVYITGIPTDLSTKPQPVRA